MNFADQFKSEGEMVLMTIHWTLDPEKVEGAYQIVDGNRKSLSMREAYTAFLRGQEVRSPWFDRQERRMLKSGRGKQAVAQELNINYAASAPLIFDEEKVKRGYMASRRPIFKFDYDVDQWFNYQQKEGVKRKRVFDFVEECTFRMNDGPIWVWEEPDPKIPYAIFADSSENVSSESDNAGVVAINCLSGNFAATGRGRWQPDQFAVVLALLGYRYNEAFLCVENNAIGSATLTCLTGRTAIRPDDDVEALQKTWLYTRLATEWRNDTVDSTKSRRLGFRTNGPTKQQLITVMRRAMEYRTDFCKDQRFWDECLGFVRDEKTRKIGNPQGDDMVISGCGAIYIAPEGRVYTPIPLRQRSQTNKDWNHFIRNLKRKNKKQGLNAIARRMQWRM